MAQRSPSTAMDRATGQRMRVKSVRTMKGFLMTCICKHSGLRIASGHAIPSIPLISQIGSNSLKPSEPSF